MDIELPYGFVCVDLETYYDDECSLSKINYEEYRRHPDFKVMAVGYKDAGHPTKVIDTHINVWREELVRKYGDSGDGTLNCVFVMHNALFDAPILWEQYLIRAKHYVDTRELARYFLPPSARASLSNVAIALFPDDEEARKGDTIVDMKGVRDYPTDLWPKVQEYCAMDVNLTAGVFNELFPKLPLNERRVIDITIQLYLDTPWKIDKEYLRQADADIYMNRERLIRESGIDRETLASTTRLGQLIETYYDSTFKQIPSPTVLNPDNTKYPFGKDHPRFKQLQKFAEEKPELKAILDARLAVSSNQEATRIRRILNSLPGEEDHFIGAALNTYGAITLRWSGTNRLNFQNQIVGSPIRRSMGTQDFETVIAHDYVSVEPRVLAYITGCQKLIDAYRNNVDLYSEFASIIYGFPVTKKTHPTERYVGKTCIIGLGYGMGATRLQAALAEGKRGPSLNFGLDECQRMVRLYRTTYPEIPTFWADVENALTVAATKTEDTTQCWGLPNNSGIRFTPRHILLPNDCHIHYPQLTIGTAKTLTDGDADKIGKLIYNTRHSKTSTWGGKITENICQGISRGITAEHVVKISEWLDENPVGMLALLVHDEIVSIVRQDGAREYVEAVDRIMTTNPSWASEDLILEVEGSYGPNYGSLEEITHERPISFI